MSYSQFILKISMLNISAICFCYFVFVVRLLWDGSIASIFVKKICVHIFQIIVLFYVNEMNPSQQFS